jgi:hypothetical protein
MEDPAPDRDTSRLRIPASLGAALGLCAVATLAFGFAPGLIAELGDLALFAAGP